MFRRLIFQFLQLKCFYGVHQHCKRFNYCDIKVVMCVLNAKLKAKGISFLVVLLKTYPSIKIILGLTLKILHAIFCVLQNTIDCDIGCKQSLLKDTLSWDLAAHVLFLSNQIPELLKCPLTAAKVDILCGSGDGKGAFRVLFDVFSSIKDQMAKKYMFFSFIRYVQLI